MMLLNNMGKEVGLIWMSAGNSYFTEGVIEELVIFALEKFDEVVIMAPDEPAEHTYAALGYKENRARRKARLNANLLQNRARRIGAKLDKEDQERLRIVEWVEEIFPDKNYAREYEEIIKLFESSNEFKKDALADAKRVLEGRVDEVSEEMLQEAVKYLLEELAFITASPEIYGADNVSYIYHHSWPVYTNYLSGKYDGKVRKKLKFVLHKSS